MLIKYEKIGSRYKKSGKDISIDLIKKELKKYQIDKLNKTNTCNVRLSDEKNSKNIKILEKIRKLYKIEVSCNKKRGKFEIWKKNIKYGYYNFITYTDTNDQDIIDSIILTDYNEDKDL